MYLDCKNIYQTARNIAGYTQQQAAELLHISIRSLADYESGKTVPPDNIVCSMMNTYSTPWLGYQYLQTSNEVGQIALPSLKVTDIAKAVLKLQKEMNDVKNINSEMIDIACDGIIHDHEVERWEVVKKEVREVISASLTVMYATSGHKKIAAT